MSVSQINVDLLYILSLMSISHGSMSSPHIIADSTGCCNILFLRLALSTWKCHLISFDDECRTVLTAHRSSINPMATSSKE
jgi:hypothetical protein